MHKIIAICTILFCGNVTARLPDTVMPVDAKIENQSAMSLSAEWWKWAMSSSDESNPVRDLTGANCGIAQTGNIWFLAGGFGSSKIQRKCEVPAEKYIFFPIINMVYWPHPTDSDLTCPQARLYSALNNDSAIDLFVEIDGKPIKKPKQFRVQTLACFDIFERAPNLNWGRLGFPAASDGYWIMLRPLKPGQHHIKFGGRYNRHSSAYGRMVQDIEYELMIK